MNKETKLKSIIKEMVSLKKLNEISIKSSKLKNFINTYRTKTGILGDYYWERYFNNKGGRFDFSDISDDEVKIVSSKEALRYKKDLIFWISEKEKINPLYKKPEQKIPGASVIGISFDGSILGTGPARFSDPVVISPKISSISKLSQLSEKAVVVVIEPTIEYKGGKFKVKYVYKGKYHIVSLNKMVSDLMYSPTSKLSENPEFKTKSDAIEFGKKLIDGEFNG